MFVILLITYKNFRDVIFVVYLQRKIQFGQFNISSKLIMDCSKKLIVQSIATTNQVKSFFIFVCN